MACTESSRVLTAGSDGLRLLDVASGDVLAHDPRTPLQTLALTSDGTVVVGAKDAQLDAWRLDGGSLAHAGTWETGGRETCALLATSDARALIAVHYDSSAVTVHGLGPDGLPDGRAVTVPLTGFGPDAERQEASHPHHAIEVDGRVLIVDLGADAIGELDVPGALAAADAAASDLAATPPVDLAFRLPPGTGPRHARAVPDGSGRLVVSGELDSAVHVIAPDGAVCSTAASHSRLRIRNYPSDVLVSADGRLAYLANRGAHSVAAFDISGDEPVWRTEVEVPAWPQKLALSDDSDGRPCLLVACRDGDAVAVLPLDDAGIPTDAAAELPVPGADWVEHVDRPRNKGRVRELLNCRLSADRPPSA